MNDNNNNNNDDDTSNASSCSFSIVASGTREVGSLYSFGGVAFKRDNDNECIATKRECLQVWIL